MPRESLTAKSLGILFLFKVGWATTIMHSKNSKCSSNYFHSIKIDFCKETMQSSEIYVNKERN